MEEYISVIELKEKFDVNPQTITNWAKKHPEIIKRMKKIEAGPRHHKWVLALNKIDLPALEYHLNGDGGVKHCSDSFCSTVENSSSSDVAIFSLVKELNVNHMVVSNWLRTNGVTPFDKRVTGTAFRFAKHIKNSDADRIRTYLKSFNSPNDGMTQKQITTEFQCTLRAVKEFMDTNPTKCGKIDSGHVKPRIVLNEYLEDFEKFLTKHYRSKRDNNELVFFYLIALNEGNLIKTGCSENPDDRCKHFAIAIPRAVVIGKWPCLRKDEEEMRQFVMQGMPPAVSSSWISGREVFVVVNPELACQRAEDFSSKRGHVIPNIPKRDEKSRFAGVTREDKYRKVTWMARLMIGDRYMTVASECATEEDAAIQYDYHVRNMNPGAEFLTRRPNLNNQRRINFPEYDFSGFVPQRRFNYKTGMEIFGE